MTKIKIIGLVPGNIHEWVKEAFIGIVVEAREHAKSFAFPYADLMTILMVKNPQAAQYLVKNMGITKTTDGIFDIKKELCEVIAD